MHEDYFTPYLPTAIYFLILLISGGLMINGSKILGPRLPNPRKASTYECGVPLKGSALDQFPVKFYLLAILFVLFDIEIVFLIPWAVVFRDFGLLGLAEMFIFLGVLGFGLLYAWRRKGLEWE